MWNSSAPPGLARRGAARFLLIPLACLALTSCGDLLQSYPEGPESPGLGGIEDEVTRLVNDYRQSIGCRRLVWSDRVADVALAHSTDMLERDYFGHYDPDGRSLADRLTAARVSYRVAGENLAQGFRYEDAARAVFDAWMKSASHRKIIENCDYVVHGVGVIDYRWTHVFLRQH